MTTERKSEPDLVRSLYLLWGHHPRPGRSGITVERIVRAGIELADQEGIGATSMRNVAERLGVSTMALYNHVPGKDDLTALMIDAVYAELYAEDDPRAAGDWRAGLRVIAEHTWDLYARHPWLLDVQDTRIGLGPHAARKYEAEIRVLDGIGLSDLDMEASLTTLLNIVAGAARASRSDVEVQRRSGMADAEWWAIVAPVLDRLMTDADYPVSGRVGTTVGQTFDAAHSPRYTLDTGVAILIAGIDRLVEDASPADG